MKIVFVLVRPKVQENIGFVCRSMKTMGFTELRMVNPPELSKKAFVTSYQSQEVLENATKFTNLKDAISDLDFSVATSAAVRGVHYDSLPISELNGFLQSKSGSIKSMAIVFGSEENGLTNDEVGLCDVATFVPMKTTYPSLNLSHCVMLYAYELSRLAIQEKETIEEEEVNYPVFKSKMEQLFVKFGITENELLHQRLVDRLPYLGKGDAGLLLSAFRYFFNK